MKKVFLSSRLLLLLISMLFSISIVVTGMGQTYAYYQNDLTHQIICTKTKNLPVSNCMTEDGQTVLLNDWKLSDTAKVQAELLITLDAEAQDIEGNITCQSEHGYLIPTLLDANNVAVSADQPMIIKAGETTNIRLVLKKNTDVLTNLNEELQESVNVIWTNSVEEETIENEDVEEVEVESISANVLVNIVPKEIIQPEIAEEEETTDQVLPVEDNLEEDETATDGTGIDEDVQQDKFLTDGILWEADVDMLTIHNSVFSSTDSLVASITYPTDAESIEISTTSFSGITGFPAFTRYSLDEGQTYVILAEGGSIRLPVSATGTDVLHVDISKAQIVWNESTCTIDTVGLNGSRKTVSQADIVEAKSDIADALELTTESNPALVTKERNLIWSVKSSVPTVDYKIEVLTKDGYREVILEDMLLCEVAMTADGTGMIRISSQNGLAKAGTYRLTVSQMYDNIEVQKKEVTFFVNYR